MKLVWKGFMSDKNKFVYDELPKDSKNLFPERGQWAVYLLIIPILLITLVGFKLRWTYAAGMMFSKFWFFVGAAVSLFFLVVHELIHALCCPRGAIVYFYAVPHGVYVVPTRPLRKYRYLFVLIMPTIVLGLIPFMVWMCIPNLHTEMSSALFGFALGSLSMSIGDLYNAILAMIKMKSNSMIMTSGTSCYYFEDK